MAIADIGDFVKVDFTNGTTPPINATNMDALENRVQDIDDALSTRIVFNSTTETELNTRLAIDSSNSKSLYRSFDASDTDISALISSTTKSGGMIQAPTNSCYVIGLRENGVNDAVYILSGGGDYATDTTYDTIVASFLANGNHGIGTDIFGTSGTDVIGIANGTEPTTSPANMIQVYSKDSSAGSANATLAIRTEQAVESIGTFTASHKLRVWINGVEYYIQLDAV
jgi:hypothetical protein